MLGYAKCAFSESTGKILNIYKNVCKICKVLVILSFSDDYIYRNTKAVRKLTMQ